ncbi:ligase-associated DNA damage response exonuclease [Xanthobacter sp. V4C-4]|uniref:ligase-associated DNA damage response exonuclease n=1 Tax=Xanthobacter cornucopiae TaxID=3119924 RepID=UPI00372CDE41
MRAEDLLCPSPKGLYCPAGDFYVDPLRAVPRAVVTHGHSDHARAGHGAVLATTETLDLMALRLGPGFTGARQPLAYGAAVEINGVRVSLHPAGHVLGSAQVRLEKDGLVIVVSGDYKDAADPTCVPFEPVRCHVFVTEATFGLPVFRHPPAAGEVARLLASAALFPERTHLVGAYSLGKAQRLMALIRQAGFTAPLHLHGALAAVTDYYVSRGQDFGALEPVAAGAGRAGKAALAGAIVIAPPMAMTDLWARRFADPLTVFASGWMRVRARARQRGVELPLVVSDHADWDGLCASVGATGCEELWVTHGAEDALVHWAHTRQLRARPLRLVGYGDEDGASEPGLPGGAA